MEQKKKNDKTYTLITGGAGFIGSHLVQLLHEKHNLIILDDLSSGKLENISQLKTEFLDGKIENFSFVEKIFKDFSIDTVVHLAAKASVDFCEKFPTEAKLINLDSSINLLKLSENYGVKKFIFASSAAVYGEPKKLPLSEFQADLRPLGLYGQWKLDFENVLTNSTSKIKTYSFRFFNVYGERQDPKSPYSGVISLFLNEFLNSAQPSLKIFGTGLQTRDFIYVGDIVDVIEQFIASKNIEIESGIFNIGTGNPCSILDLIKNMEDFAKKSAIIKYMPAQNKDIPHSLADIFHLKSVLPHFSPISLRNGLKKFF